VLDSLLQETKFGIVLPLDLIAASRLSVKHWIETLLKQFCPPNRSNLDLRLPVCHLLIGLELPAQLSIGQILFTTPYVEAKATVSNK